MNLSRTTHARMYSRTAVSTQPTSLLLTLPLPFPLPLPPPHLLSLHPFLLSFLLPPFLPKLLPSSCRFYFLLTFLQYALDCRYRFACHELCRLPVYLIVCLSTSLSVCLSVTQSILIHPPLRQARYSKARQSCVTTT